MSNWYKLAQLDVVKLLSVGGGRLAVLWNNKDRYVYGNADENLYYKIQGLLDRKNIKEAIKIINNLPILERPQKREVVEQAEKAPTQGTLF